jgi:hypothetical protein
MKRAVKIEFEQWEGRIDQLAKGTFEGSGLWAKANALIAQIAARCPKDMLGCLKCGFTVTFDDGDTYEGRFEVKPFGSGTLEAHIKHHCEFHSGRATAPWMGEKRYRAFLEDVVKPEAQAAYAKILDEYELGDHVQNAQEAWLEAMGG